MKNYLPILFAGAAWAASSVPGAAQEAAPAPPAAVSGTSLLEEAKTLQTRGQLRQALAKCTQVLEADPKLTEGWLLQSRLLQERGEFDKAMESCNKALELDAKNIPARLQRGSLLRDQKQYEPALQLAQELLDEQAELSAAWSLMGEVRLLLNEPEAALANFDQAVETGKKDAAAYAGRAKAYAEVGALHEAAQDYDQAISLNPKDAVLWVERGLIRHILEEETGAEEDYTQAIKLGSRDVRAFLYRGQIRLGQEKWKDALDDLTEAKDLDPENVEALTYRSDARYQLDDYAGAVMDLRRAVALKPEDAVLHGRLAEACLRGGDDDALTHFSEAIRLAPEVARYWTGRGSLYRQKGDITMALEDMSRGLKLEPDNLYALVMRASALLQVGRFQEAKADTDNALKLPDGASSGWANFLRGQACWGLGDHATALKEFEAASSPGKEVTQAELWLWLAQTRLGQTEAAQTRIQAYAKRMDGERIRDGGTVQFLTGKTTEEAYLKAIENANATRPQWERVRECYYFAGASRLAKGDKAGAALLFRRCLENPDKSGLETHLARQELKWLDEPKPSPSKE